MLAFFQANAGTICAGLAAVGLLCGIVGPKLPAGPVQKAVLALAHLLPGDVAQAVQKLSS